MNNSKPITGPGEGIVGIGQRLFSTVVSIAETRLRLIVVELEEEKANLLQMLLMVGLIMIFSIFGLMSLLVLVIVAVDPQYRLYAISITTGVLFGLAIIMTIWVVAKSKKSSLLKHTRNELGRDRKALEERNS